MFRSRRALETSLRAARVQGKHAAGVHDLLGGVQASVNLATEEDEEEDEGDLYVNVARVRQEEDDWQEPDDSWLDLDGGESEDKEGVNCISACMRKDAPGLEEEFKYFPNITLNKDEEEAEEDRGWSPELSGLQSEEEDEKTDRYTSTAYCLGGAAQKESKHRPHPPEATRQLASLALRRSTMQRESKHWPRLLEGARLTTSL
jgi:hypothetical protein